MSGNWDSLSRKNVKVEVDTFFLIPSLPCKAFISKATIVKHLTIISIYIL